MPAQRGTCAGETLVESAIKMGVGRVVIDSDYFKRADVGSELVELVRHWLGVDKSARISGATMPLVVATTVSKDTNADYRMSPYVVAPMRAAGACFPSRGRRGAAISLAGMRMMHAAAAHHMEQQQKRRDLRDRKLQW